MSPSNDSRITCCVPGCHRTIGERRYCKQFKCEPGDWFCPAHWKKVPRRLKGVRQRHEREFRRYGFYPREAAYERVWQAMWRAMLAKG